MIVMSGEQEGSETCSQCGYNSLHPDLVRSAFWHDDRLVVIKDIPALVCENCREQYYDDATVVMIDLLRGEGFPAGQADEELSVPVFSLKHRTKRGEGT
jgi:YgiT-type zinc finger domain-containing protein